MSTELYEVMLGQSVEVGADSWMATEGDTLHDFLEHCPTGARDEIRKTAVEILSRGINPRLESGTKTGLVTGYVQSGKTLSFESVAALARDNGFAVTIVIAGSSNPLLDQSIDRLKEDLDIDSSGRPRRWVHFRNPNSINRSNLQNLLDDWLDPETPTGSARAALITVLKHGGHLNKLASLMGSLDLTHTAILVIDDEADQAGLNNRASASNRTTRTGNDEPSQQTESAIYSKIQKLRCSLPKHTYLQYTATPQATLLVNIADSLSPDFVQVLDPGAGYVGGSDLFSGRSPHVHIIPESETPTRNNPLSDPPDSLLHALRVFLVGAAIGVIRESAAGNRSMLIHPSQTTDLHHEFESWVQSFLDHVRSLLNAGPDDPDYQDLIEDFRVAYDDIGRTLSPMPCSMDELIGGLKRTIRQTSVREVNAARGRTPDIDWNQDYAWILIGGQAMDRGFTVEGLTVTYMPRGLGVGNADTVQQRARFLGYKQHYLPLCRIFLNSDVYDAFRAYVEHEEDIRGQLKAVQLSNQPLDEWKRAFVLDPGLRPCRNSVIKNSYSRGFLANKWYSPSVVWVEESRAIDRNRHLLDRFVSGIKFQPDEGHPNRSENQRHLVSPAVPVATVLESLLIPYSLSHTSDAEKYTGVLLQIQHYLENTDPAAIASVYIMGPLDDPRERLVLANGQISNLYQGAAPPTRQGEFSVGEIYPGDQHVKHPNNLTIQIHTLKLRDSESRRIAEDVRVVALFIPTQYGIGWVVQEY